MGDVRDPLLPEESASWAPGHRVGDYQLLTRIGGGGMGVVFSATHVASGARHALKVLLTTDPDLRARFQREAEAMAKTDRHANIVRVHSVGEHRGRPYIAMELLPGGDLAHRLRAGPLPPREAVAVVQALCRGLEHVHAKGVLHRDLKPANVIFDESGSPKLVDFGLARGPTDGALTRTGELVGTPSFMAPEQAEGRRGEQDVRTDVYGVGALLYNALSGRPPFEGTSLMGVLERVIHETPAPPSAFAPGVPRALDDACLRALAKRPADRFASVAELSRALDQALESPPQTSRRGLVAPAIAGVTVIMVMVVVAAVAARPTDPVVVTTEPAVPVSAAPVVTKPPAKPVEGAAPVVRPETIKDIPRPPAKLPSHAQETMRSVFFDLNELDDPDSGVAVAVAREIEAVDPLLSASYLRFAAENGADDDRAGHAWLELGKLFERGKGVAKSDGQALECFRRSAEKGHAAGLIKLAEAQARGWFDEPKDPVTAAATFRRALAAPVGLLEPGWLEEQVGFGLARIALQRPDLVPFEELEPLLRGAFDRKKEARLLLARVLAQIRNDIPAATKILDDLIERHDHAGAHAQRALLLFPGAPERADELFAGPRDPYSRAVFAWDLWEDGKEVPGVRARAVEILRPLPSSGDGQAVTFSALCLGRIFIMERAAGRTTAVTEGEAKRLLELAAQAGGEWGRDARDELARLRKQ